MGARCTGAATVARVRLLRGAAFGQPLALSCAAHPLLLPSQVGTLYSMHDGRKTLQNVFALDLFDNVQVG